MLTCSISSSLLVQLQCCHPRGTRLHKGRCPVRHSPARRWMVGSRDHELPWSSWPGTEQLPADHLDTLISFASRPATTFTPACPDGDRPLLCPFTLLRRYHALLKPSCTFTILVSILRCFCRRFTCAFLSFAWYCACGFDCFLGTLACLAILGYLGTFLLVLIYVLDVFILFWRSCVLIRLNEGQSLACTVLVSSSMD